MWGRINTALAIASALAVAGGTSNSGRISIPYSRGGGVRRSVPREIQHELIAAAQARRERRAQRADGCMPVAISPKALRLAAGTTRQQRRKEQGFENSKHKQVQRMGKRAYARSIAFDREQHGGWVSTPWGKIRAELTRQLP